MQSIYGSGLKQKVTSEPLFRSEDKVGGDVGFVGLRNASGKCVYFARYDILHPLRGDTNWLKLDSAGWLTSDGSLVVSFSGTLVAPRTVDAVVRIYRLCRDASTMFQLVLDIISSAGRIEAWFRILIKSVLNTMNILYVCMVITYSKGKVQQGKVANPTCGQLNREHGFFPWSRWHLRIWSRETGSAVPSRVSLLISILTLNLVFTYGIPPEFRGGVHLYMI